VLLERERELGELRTALDEVSAGAGRAIGIEAAAGLGKTQLLREARVGAAAAGLAVLAGRATELERDFPFALARQLLGPGIASLPRAQRDRVFDGASAARGALGLDVGEGRSNDAFAVLHALYWVTAALAEHQPLLLAVDDAHSADAASLDYLGFLLPRLEDLPLLLIFTGRPGEPDPSGGFQRLVTDVSVRHMPLAPLSAEATKALLAADLEVVPAPDFAHACFEVSAGNPFLLRELSRTVAQRGIEPRSENAEQMGELVPERVSQTVLMRLERLSPQASELAGALAVLGEGADLRLVAELSDVDMPLARAAADELRGAVILEPEPLLRFIHPLVRNAIYSSLAFEERSRLHLEAAMSLRARGANPVDIATQLLAAERRGDREAVDTLVEAGKKALAAGAPRSTVAYLTRALGEPPPEDMKAAVLGPLITASLRAVDLTTLASIEAGVLEELERDSSLRVLWAIDLATWMAISGRFEEAASMLTEAIDLALEQDDMEKAFQFEAQLRTISMALPSAPEIDLARYRDQIEPDTPGGRLAAALEAGSAAAEGSAGDAAAAAKRALGEDGALFAEELDFTAPMMVIFTLIVAEEVETARRGAEQALAFALERGATTELSLARGLNGMVAWAAGDLTSAEADLRQSIQLARLVGLPPIILTVTAILIEVLVERDELPAAEAELKALGLAEGPLPDGPLFTGLHLARGRWLFHKGEIETALADFTALARMADARGVGGGPALMACPEAVQALLAAGRNREASDWAADSLVAGERWDTPATIAHVLRAVAATRPRPAGLIELEKAVEMLTGSPMRIVRAQVLLDLGSTLRREGRRADARGPLREAFDLARHCGAARIARRAHDELQATGEKVRRYTPIGIESLTPSERRVAELAASGMTNRQIAQSLFVTVKTVEAHLSAAYDKLDIGSRKELPAALAAGSNSSPV
jgi:DNA-binding CsgD family transcriptional regulator